jgi:type IV pilus assembly protein PilC
MKPNNKNNQLTFNYHCIDKDGKTWSGQIEAQNIHRAKSKLRQQGLSVKKINRRKTNFLNRPNRKISGADITLFSRQLATLFDSGIPMFEALDIIAKGQNNKKFKVLLTQVKDDLLSGLTLTQALKKHPLYFNTLYTHLVDAGEQSGTLDLMLDKIANYKEKIERIKKRIKKTLTYPIAIVIMTFLVSAGLLLFVVPEFESLYAQFGAPLPLLTQVVVDLAQFVQSYWLFLLLGLLTSLGAFFHAKKHSLTFAQNLDESLLKIPVIGSILGKACIARFARTLCITFAAGLPLVEALKSVSGATGNRVFANATDKIASEVATGQRIYVAMKNTQVFPNLALQMIGIGEESGNLENMLCKVADFYEEEVDNAVDSLSNLFEPVIMTILGVLIGGLVVAMYLPIFKLGQAI